MSNVLHPLASRYSLFFTVALFDSSRVCQSRHPTKTVQDMVLEAQERYERLDRKHARHKLRALLRNVLTASARTSDPTGTLFTTHRTTMAEDSTSTEWAGYTPSSSSLNATTAKTTLSSEQWGVDPSLGMRSFPPALITENADVSAISSNSQHDTALAGNYNSTTAETASTTVIPPSSSSMDNCRQQHRPPVSEEAVTHSSSLLSPSRSNKLVRAIKRKAKQLKHNGRTSIATLLSIALTTLFLSMLQRRRHRLTVLARKGVLLVRTPSRQAHGQAPRREMKSCASANAQPTQQQKDPQDQHLRQQSHHRCQVSPLQDHPGRLRLHRRDTLVSSASSSSFSLSSPLSSPTYLPSSPSLHRILPSSFNMIAAATAASPSTAPHPTPTSTKEAYVSAWLQHQNLHDRAAWSDHHSNRPEPNHSNYPLSPVYSHPSYNNSTNGRHRRSLSLMSPSEFGDEIRSSHAETQSNQPHRSQSSRKQKRHSSAPTHSSSSKGHSGGSTIHLASPAAANLASTHTTTPSAATTAKSKKHRRHMSMHEPCSRSPEEQAWDFHYYYQRQQREQQVYLEEQHRIASLRGEVASLALTSNTVSTSGLYRHASHPMDPSYVSSYTTESLESAVARAKSLNRLAAPALLSRETSKALGICRSDTLSTNGKNKTQERDLSSTGYNSRSASPPPLPMSRDRSRTMNFSSWDQSRGAPSTPPISLKHRKTLKEHLTPSFRSLASRFGGGNGGGYSGSGSTSRPSSSPAGSKGDLLSFDNGSSRSATPTLGSNRHSVSGSHLLDFKPLKAGPETAEHLRRCSLEQQRPAWSNSIGAKTHRRGTSFSCSVSPLDGESRSFDRGGCLANRDNVVDDDEEQDDEHEKGTPHGETEVCPESMFCFDGQPSHTHQGNGGNDSMKKQILTLLSIRRKSKSSLKSNSTSTTMMAASPMCLSPLELEAQDLPWDEEDDEDVDEDDEDEGDEETYGHGLSQMDVREHHHGLGKEGQEVTYPFNFMLVPKDQYEFQPLVV
ncbi:hypothetical protein EMPS_01090 [Entomortierella parvispora]|uniref:Uncharacterized protein n=1 Tax=Entomortierella parvispora TaxID=205924 RepID=A0A9P3H273_9FUNG|nr:hypothetical protein EMPS_01090 [Entomortierella parvispora]